ncbi:hypothetical protein HPP92_027680, partial [Vanilla planifolia]
KDEWYEKLHQEAKVAIKAQEKEAEADAIKNGDAISKLQKVKNALVEIITRLTDQASLLTNQLENMMVQIVNLEELSFCSTPLDLDMKQQVQGVLNLIDLVKRASAKSGSTGDDIKDNPE